MLTGKKTLGAAAIITAIGFIQQSGIIDIVPENYKGLVVASIGLVMAVLRFMTKTPIV